MPESSCLLALSHSSRLDPFLIAVLPPGPPLRFVAKSQLFRWPLVSALLSLGAFPVQRGTRDVDFLNVSRQALALGHRLIIFPQGGIYRDIDKSQARWGAGNIAQDHNVVPVLINTRKRLIRFGPPQQFVGNDLEVSEQMIESIQRLGRG